MFGLFRNKEKELKKAKEKLEFDLRSNGIDFLIEKMGSEALFSPLLNKKRTKEVSITDEISWYAFRRAEELNTDLEKEDLLKILKSGSTSIKKKHIYFALSHLCKNRKDKSLFNYLMDCLESENDLETRIVILTGLRTMEKSPDLNIAPLKQFAKAKKGELKTQAIFALQKTKDPEVEPLLLDVFQNTNDSHIKKTICSSLESVGTAIAIPILDEAFKKTRDYGLKSSINLTVEQINKHQQLTKAKNQ